MHPWGKWGRDFTEYGVVAARAALAEAGLDWRQIQLVAGADTIRNGYPGFVAGATFAQKLGWNGVPVSSSYAACASGSQALQSARAQILAGFCDVALVIGADTTPKGFFAPVGGERKNDPDWQRFHLIGATNTVYFALLARRRIDLYGATLEDFAQVKVKNARHGLDNPNARYRKEASVEDVLASPVVSDPLRLLDICATSDGAAALIVASKSFAEKHLGSVEGVPSVRAISTVTPRYPQHLPELPDIATDSTAVVPGPGAGVQGPDPRRRLRRGRPRTRGPEPGRGLRPVHGARARLVRASRACAPGARPSSCCVAGRRPSAAGSRSMRPVGWRVSERRSRRRRSRRCASSPGSSRVRPQAARWRAPRSASPPIRVCSGTARRSSSRGSRNAPRVRFLTDFDRFSSYTVRSANGKAFRPRPGRRRGYCRPPTGLGRCPSG